METGTTKRSTSEEGSPPHRENAKGVERWANAPGPHRVMKSIKRRFSPLVTFWPLNLQSRKHRQPKTGNPQCTRLRINLLSLQFIISISFKTAKIRQIF